MLLNRSCVLFASLLLAPIAAHTAAAAPAPEPAEPAEPAEPNGPPVASTGGNSGVDYVVDCNNSIVGGNPVTSVQLDGSGSFDPDGTPVTFFWHNECKSGHFDDPTSPTPVYHVDMTESCARECWIALRVSSGGQTTIVGFRVIVQDVTAPALTIPSDYLGIWGDSIDVATTGTAAATDNCDLSPVISFADVVVPPTGPGQPELTVERTWTVTDCAGLQQSALQTIQLLAPTGAPGFDANLDFDPRQCPNVFDLGESGSVDVLLLGSDSFRAEHVIPGSVRLRVRQVPGVTLVPSSLVLRDLGSISATTYGDCNSQTLDGKRDLRLRFDRGQLAAQLGLAQFSGQVVEITVTGFMTTSKLFGTRDYITVQ